MAQLIDPAAVQGGGQSGDGASGASGNGANNGSMPAQGFTEGLTEINRDFKEREVMRRAGEIGLAYIDIAKTPVNPDLLRMVTSEMAQKALLIPFMLVGHTIRAAVVDPEKAEAKSLVEELKGRRFEVELNLCSESSFQEALHVYDFEKSVKKQELITEVEQERIAAYEKEIALLADMREKVEKLTAEEALNFIEVGAMKTNASDIHYEPGERLTRVRFRIDGVLHKIFDLDTAIYHNLVNQLKYRSKMKMNVNTIPQDGRYSFMLNNRKVDVRASAIPTAYGESFVCRLLDSGKGVMNFEDMGFSGRYLEIMNHLADLSHGMILVTGPTGSGKTTTLYALLAKFNQMDTKIITLEDPVEYQLSGVTQSQIDEAHGYTFAAGLRSILRQDPDVIMLGEIRDLETATTAAQAALTGHVLLATLHTNSAIESVPRLLNMGLAEFMIGPALNTLIAQRLVRKVCTCRKMEAPGPSDLKKFEETIKAVNAIRPDLQISIPAEIPRLVGCDACSKTGYKGRLVISEIVTIDHELEELILQKAGSGKLLEMARKKGMITMEEDGVLKAISGLTTLEEVFRATNIIV